MLHAFASSFCLGSSMPIDRRPEDSPGVEDNARCLTDQRRCMSFPSTFHITIADWCDVGQVTIDTLSDEALLYVFDFYVAQAEVEASHKLVHVCRRWRINVFGSPRRLNLRIALECTDETPVKEKLDIWPALPIVISGRCESSTSLDNSLHCATSFRSRTY